MQYIKYPFTPKSFYVDIIEEEVRDGEWESIRLVDPSQLDAVREYYKFKLD